MKLLRVNCLVLFLVTLSFTSSSQEKKDNLITVTVSDSSDLFNKVTSLLQAEGYKLSESTTSRNNINTKAKTVGNYTGTICVFNFQFSGNTIFVRGNWHFSNWERGKISFHKSSFLPGWKEMDRLAKLLGTPSYSLEEVTNSK
jgi:hypothetical protein